MDMYPFTYTVHFYDDCNEYTLTRRSGITLAETCSEAMENIARFYGEQSIYKCEITAIGDAQSVIELSQSEVMRLENESIFTD